MNKNVREILEILRELPFAWIADEIELEIQKGKTQKKFQKDKNKYIKNETETLEYSFKEQIRICLEFIDTYFMDLPKMWEETKNEFSNLFKEENDNYLVYLKILDSEGDIFKPFSNENLNLYYELNEYLSKAGFPINESKYFDKRDKNG